MSLKIKISSIMLIFLVACASGCSLHYNQQADSQTLDIEVMRPVTVSNHNPPTDP